MSFDLYSANIWPYSASSRGTQRFLSSLHFQEHTWNEVKKRDQATSRMSTYINPKQVDDLFGHVLMNYEIWVSFYLQSWYRSVLAAKNCHQAFLQAGPTWNHSAVPQKCQVYQNKGISKPQDTTGSFNVWEWWRHFQQRKMKNCSHVTNYSNQSPFVL